MANVIVLLLALGWFGGPPPKVEPPPGALLTLSKGPCYGICPVYDLVLYKDGTIEYSGHEHVRVEGLLRYRISPEQVEALEAAIERSHFERFPPGYPCGATDNPVATLCIAGKSSPRCVSFEPRHTRELDDGGVIETGAPVALAELVHEIEQTADVLRLTLSDKRIEEALEGVLTPRFAELMCPCPIRSCLERTRGGGCDRVHGRAAAPVVFDFTIDGRGELAHFSVHDTKGSLPPETVSCLSDVVHAWTFPSRGDGKSMGVHVILFPCDRMLSLDVKTR